MAFLALHFMQIFLFNNLSSASGKRAIFVTCYYFLLLIRYIARLKDVKTYNVFHQKITLPAEFATFSALLFHMSGFFPILQTQNLFIGSVVYSVPCRLKTTAVEQ